MGGASDESKNAIIEEIVGQVGNPLATLEDMGKSLETLWECAKGEGNQAKADLISRVWQQAQSITDAVNVSVDVAAVTREALAAMRAEHEGLVRAIKIQDRDNPLVESMIEDVEHQAKEHIWDTHFTSEDVAMDMYNGGLIVDENDAAFFHELLFSANSLTEYERETLESFITEFVEQVEERREAERNALINRRRRAG